MLKWKEGEQAADVIDRHFVSRQHFQIDSGSLISESDFIRHLELNTPAELTRNNIKQLLNQGRSRGLPHVERGGAVFYDQCNSWNWLYDHDDRFFESDYRASEDMRKLFFEFRNDRLVPKIKSQRYKVKYQYKIYANTLPISERVLLFLPYPIPTIYQKKIYLKGCQPQNLADYLVPSAGFFYAYPIFSTNSSNPFLTFSYTCEVSVIARSTSPQAATQVLDAENYRAYTEIDQSLENNQLIKEFRDRLDLSEITDDYERSKRIYLELIRTKRFKKTMEECRCPNCSAQQLLKDSGGHCTTLANAFIALCRLEGIPAREQTGALIGYPLGSNQYSIGTFNDLIYGHTWAEVFAPDYGWFPVEFHGVAIGEVALTRENVQDKVLRQHIKDQSRAYEDLYFGNLDCHRIMCSNSVKRISHILCLAGEGSAISRFLPLKNIKYECTMDCKLI